jgi:polyferredoxin
MLVSSLVMLGVASIATYLSLNFFKDDAFRAVTALTAFLLVILALTIAPLPLQMVLVLGTVLVFDRFNNWLCKKY